MIAVLYYWNGSKEEVQIKKEWIDDIVDAVEGQYYFCGNGIAINGGDIFKVDIYEVNNGRSN